MPLLKGGLVLVDFDTAAVKQVIPLQYNPESLTRSLQVQGVGAESGVHVDQMRLKGPPIETIKLEIVIDATDRMEHPDQDPTVSASGIQPQLSALEMTLYPSSAQLLAADANTRNGTLEIVPMDSPLMLFVWSKERVVPVRITEFSITEEAFDSALNPIRAKVSLGMRVLSVDDLGFSTKGGGLYLSYQQRKESLAAKATGGALSALGLTSLT